MIWTVLYKGIYPFFLRYYHDEFCKTIFWNLFLLFTLTWGFVSLYVVLDVGFYWVWLPWMALFPAVWWLVPETKERSLESLEAEFRNGRLTARASTVGGATSG